MHGLGFHEDVSPAEMPFPFPEETVPVSEVPFPFPGEELPSQDPRTVAAERNGLGFLYESSGLWLPALFIIGGLLVGRMLARAR